MDLITWFETQSRIFPKAICVDLLHIRASGPARITRFIMPDKDRASLVSLVLTSAHNAAEGFRGAQTFVVCLLEEHGNEPLCQHPILVHDSQRPEELAANSEGVLKQVMQHNAMLMKRVNENIGQSHQSHRILAEENERLRARCDVVEDKHLQLVALQEELLSLRHERELASSRAASAERRKDFLAASVTSLAPAVLPAVAHKALGVPLPPQDPAVGAFAKSLSPEQLKSLQGLLRSEQLAALGHLFQRHGGIPNGAPPGAPPVPHKPSGNTN